MRRDADVSSSSVDLPGDTTDASGETSTSGTGSTKYETMFGCVNNNLNKLATMVSSPTPSEPDRKVLQNDQNEGAIIEDATTSGLSSQNAYKMTTKLVN